MKPAAKRIAIIAIITTQALALYGASRWLGAATDLEIVTGCVIVWVVGFIAMRRWI